jgi:3-oxoacyl-[acyl-carrier-protein] synthase-1
VNAVFRPVAITASAAISAVGANAEQTAAAVRAGLVHRREHPSYEALLADPEWDEEHQLIVSDMAWVGDLASEGRARLLDLFVLVIQQLMEAAALRRTELKKTALLVALPLDAGVSKWALAKAFLPEALARLGLEPSLSRVALTGHAGVLELIGDASNLLSTGQAEAVIVAGVDSLLPADRLAYLDAAYRAKSPRNRDGMCPGEAASALLLEDPKRTRREVLGTITSLGTGEEPEPFTSDKVSTATGSTRALRAALGGSRPSWVLCDLNGESYRAFEWGVVQARLGEAFEGLSRVTFPALSIGDVGAATGGLLISIALQAKQRGWAPGGDALVWTSSDDARRAAARLQLT